MEQKDKCEREHDGKVSEMESMYKEAVEKAISQLRDYKLSIVGLNPEDYSSSTVPGLKRMVDEVTEQELVIRLSEESMISVKYWHSSETTSKGFSFVGFGHK